ncbi:nitrogen fixation protein FixH [Roseibium denhamense]|uniref:Nitrogen fixation protein FixH n=1 Tax=Roseibium denhamense TaxID=76305 RepID=A0ABY1P634_9HYPH|nr:FixH family protein [Roseibium denhamense]MTI07209.1 nitrogen fixation protein FixH [Roseibium denhamense]SMP26604.1 Nitrogen fixation protein FixH [Roseibium denhamense]
MATIQTHMKDPKAITGKTVLVWLLSFFAVVFTANAIFIYLALGSFPGVAVESSYEAGQSYNQEIAAAAEQHKLNWQIGSVLERTNAEAGRLLVTAADADGAPLYGVAVSAVLQHPAQQTADIDIVLTADGGGRYIADLDRLPAGNWNLVLVIEQDGMRKFKSENRVFVKE